MSETWKRPRPDRMVRAYPWTTTYILLVSWILFLVERFMS